MDDGDICVIGVVRDPHGCMDGDDICVGCGVRDPLYYMDSECMCVDVGCGIPQTVWMMKVPVWDMEVRSP